MDGNIAIWIAILPAIMISMAPLLMATKDPQREKALDSYARKVNLAMTPEVRPRVITRLRSYERSALVGAGVGLAIGLPLMIIVNVSTDQPAGGRMPLAIAISVTLGAVYAPVITSVRQTFSSYPGRRIARASSPSITDYVPTLERVSAPIGIAITALALIIGCTLLSTGVLVSDTYSPTGFLLSPGAFLGYLSVLTWIVGLIVQRLLLRTGQIAGSEQELAWNDALRAMTLRGVAVLPFFVSGIATMIIFFQVISLTAKDPTPMMAGIAMIALLGYLSLITIGIAVNVLNVPAQHYWRRLWKQRTEQSA